MSKRKQNFVIQGTMPVSVMARIQRPCNIISPYLWFIFLCSDTKKMADNGRNGCWPNVILLLLLLLPLSIGRFAESLTTLGIT